MLIPARRPLCPFELQHQVFPLGRQCAKLFAKGGGQFRQPLRLRRRNINAQLLLGGCNRGLNPRNLLFEKRAPFLHLLLLDRI